MAQRNGFQMQPTAAAPMNFGPKQVKPNVRFSVQPEQANENQALVNEFRNNCKYQPFDQAFKFKLSEQRTLWLPKQPFTKMTLLMDTTRAGEWDLSIINEVFGKDDVCMKAIQYCYTGFITVHEQHELTPFLLTCFLLQVGQPFSFINREQQYLRDLNLQLQDPSQILDIDIFIQKCQASQRYSQLVNSSMKNSVLEMIQLYSQILLASNPYYYMSPNGNNQFNPKLTKVSEQMFTQNFLQYFGSQIFQTGPNCRFISFEHVQMFYNVIQFYYLTSDAPLPDAQQRVKQTFANYYEGIRPLLTEEDQISCFQFLPGDSTEIINLLRQKTLELNQVRLRERALINVLIAQKAQNISLDAYQNQFRQSIKIMTGQDIPQEIEQLISNEIAYAKQQGRT